MKNIYILLFTFLSFGVKAQNIVALEYFFDEDPGFGNATPHGITNQLNAITLNFNVPTTFTTGMHLVGYRTKDANQKWSHTNFATFYVINNQVGTINTIEYFWVRDNGFNQNIFQTITPQQLNNYTFSANVLVPNFSSGQYSLFVRTKDTNGIFSHTNYLTNITVNEPLSIVEEEHSKTVVYPNPSKERITIQSERNINKATVYDINGRAIHVMLQNNIILVSHLQSGVYFLHLESAENFEIIKFIKE
jgi:hypothetical protein